MAEETPLSPITAVEPPKANPLAKAAAAHTSTLKLKPVIRKPAVGATQSALRPGLKLPTSPSMATAGLKLPPKPAVATAGLKLPPKPGSTVTALRPGIKLPAKPVIRKPGSAVAPAPKPAAPVAAAKPVAELEPVAELKPVADPVATPAAEVKPAPAPAAPVSEPVAAPTAEVKPAAEVKPLEVPVAVEPKKNETAALDALKLATQSLKSATAPIPAQAILRKTGIVGDQALSDAQKQAAKSKTSRISLSEAIGVAPVKNENAPMKTIRIKRPTDIPGIGGAPAAKPAAVPTAPAPAAAVPEAPKAEGAAAEATSATAAKPVTMTQRKTLKIARPSSGAVRPAGKFGIKKPGAVAAPTSAPAMKVDTPVDDGAVADIPDIPDMPAVAPLPPLQPVASDTIKDVPPFVAVLSVLAQAAACVTVGALAWMLYQDSLIF